MSSKSKIKIQYLLLFFTVMLSFFTAAIIWLDESRPNCYAFLPILPLSFGLIIILCQLLNHNLFKLWYSILPIFLYGIRDVITPLIMRYGNYYGSFRQLTRENVLNGILLMIYETLIVLCYISMRSWSSRVPVSAGYVFKRTKTSFLLFLIALFLFCSVMWVFFPEIRQSYSTMFSSAGLRKTYVTNADMAIGSSTRGMATLVYVVLPILYMMMGTQLIVFIKEKIYGNVIRILLSVFVILIPGLFMNGSDGNTIISMGSLFLTATFVFNTNKKSLIKLAVIGGIVVIGYVFIQSMISTRVFKSISLMSSLSNMFQAYFPGVCNFAGLFNIGKYNKFEEVLYDFYNTIPFRNTLFGWSGLTTVPNLYTYDNNALSHIMPCVGHAYYYIGFLAPIIPCFFYKYAYKIFIKMRSTTDPYCYMTYCMTFCYAELTPIMYNSIIFLQIYFVRLLPIMILARLFSSESNISYCSNGAIDEKQI